jgi:hypothetical protein
MAVRDGIDHSLGRRSPTVEASHRRRAERFVEKDEAAGVDPGLDDLPSRPGDDDVGPVPLGGPETFFFYAGNRDWLSRFSKSFK